MLAALVMGIGAQKDYTHRMQCQLSLAKKLTCKGILWQVFYLSEVPLASYDKMFSSRIFWIFFLGGGGPIKYFEKKKTNKKPNKIV
jgi:hypothetical protein